MKKTLLTAITLLAAGNSIAGDRYVPVEIGWSDTAIEITNTGDAALTGQTLTLYINGHISKGYKARCVAPAPNQKTRIRLRSFVRKDGLRFNPYTHALSRIYVHADGYEYSYFETSP